MGEKFYSQNCEEGVINSLFGDNGRFLEIGAFDGITFSNTRKLFERGWGGVLVEPSPKAFAGLEKAYSNTKPPHIVLIQAALDEKERRIPFYESGGDAVSTTEIGHKDRWEKGYGSKFTQIDVPTITFETILEKHGRDFSFLNIDTEGTNWKVLKLFPFDICTPMCLCIEYDNMRGQMEDYLRKWGYRTVYASGENIVCYRGPA